MRVTVSTIVSHKRQNRVNDIGAMYKIITHC